MSEAGAAPRVLLIDSNVYFVKRMTEALVKEGFQVFHHPVASYALTMIEWNPPDIILCATELRDMGAFEIVRQFVPGMGRHTSAAPQASFNL